MGKTRGVHETTPELRNRMVGMYEAGLGLREIAAAVNCSPRTVKRWLNRFDKEGTVETRERCGRKRATTSEQDEAIVRLATETPLTAAKTVLPALGLTCSVDTVRERLHKAGIHNWSPSRKYIQRIPLGNDANGNPIQQALWRPTGTQLGKKKPSKEGTKKEKASPMVKKENPSKKARARDLYASDGAPSNNNRKRAKNEQQQVEEDEDEQEEYVYQPPDIPESQPNEIQSAAQPLQPSQTEFSNALSLAQGPQPIYEHPEMNIAQSWPLDLGSHHYPQNQPNPVAHDEPPPEQQLQELHTQHEQRQRMQDQVQQTGQSHHHSLDQQQTQLPLDHQARHHQNQNQNHVKTQMPSPQANNTSLEFDDINTCSSNSSQPSDENLVKEKIVVKGGRLDRSKRKKKGGKAKGTLETSVEIRNRMIGMSEAGLSTLSIALAIDRSERTVKRWLERWHKEGNVQTKERKGRRRITTREQDEAIVAMATQHPLTAAKHVAPALGLKCSVDTIRERLHKAGIHSWKLGKKQGEGNAVHTVHLWQPSGNRPNKPKLPGGKKRKSSSGKKKEHAPGNAQKRASRKKKNESPALKMVPPPANMMPAEQPTMPFHNPGTNYVPGSNIMQPVHNIPPPPPSLAQPPPPGHPPLQPMPIMQQRPDCRLAPTIVPSVPSQANSAVAYPSCMVGNNSHANHMEQPDPLNYEPYIWSF